LRVNRYRYVSFRKNLKFKRTYIFSDNDASNFSIATIEGTLMENKVLNFLSLDINTKHFMIFQLQNYL